MLKRSWRAASCSRCVAQSRIAVAHLPCPPAESSAQAARRYASLARPTSACPHRVFVQPSIRSFSSSPTIRAAKILEGDNGKGKALDMEDFPRDRIRNISIIAHIDHGKSTLADRLLQLTGTLPASSSPQFLDKLKVEKERGITVKAQTVSLIHTHTDGERYLINLIDTPGHVDFSYEVSRSLGACEGALLLVDCTQGIQAQTLSVFHYAEEANLTLLPVINKVDLPHASPKETSEQIAATLGLPMGNHVHISAKSGLGVPQVLTSIIDELPPPPPSEETDGRLRGLVFDTFYDHFRGVVSLVRLFSGSIRKGDKVRFLQAGKKYDVLEVGVHNPEEVPVDVLLDGQVGYVVCNMKNSDEAHIGDTICHADKLVDALPGFKPMKAMVYAGVFPVDSGDFSKLEEAIERLTLNDRSVSIQRESSAALSQGFRLGFLGTLHLDVFRQRLEDEYESNVIITSPTVPFKVVYKDGREEFISNPADFPDITDPKARVAHIEEPMVAATIFVPNEYIGEMMTLCAKYRGIQQEYRILENSSRAVLRYTLPLSEIVTDFFSELKSASSGFASFDYEEAGYQRSDLVKLNMMLNSKPVDALAMVVHRNAAVAIGRTWTKKLREVLPRQLFELAIQAAIGTKVVARESLSAMRKDVTAGLYGGHYERKMKHLEKQKKGKQRLKRLAGNIDVPQSAFFDVLSSRPRGYSTCAVRRYSSSAIQLESNSTDNGDYFPSLHDEPQHRSYDIATGSVRTPAEPAPRVLGKAPTAPASGDAQHVPPSAHLPGDLEESHPTPPVIRPVLPAADLAAFLPPPTDESISLSSTPARQLDPITPHELPPQIRSQQLSNLFVLASSSTATSTEIYSAWSNLYLSAPNTRLFTPPELMTILRGMHRADHRGKLRDPHAAAQRSGIVKDVLGDISPGVVGRAARQILVAELQAEAYRKTVGAKTLKEAERKVAVAYPKGFPSAPYWRDKLVIIHLITQILALAAKVPDGDAFERWMEKREAAGGEPDGHIFTLRLLLLANQKKLDALIEAYNDGTRPAMTNTGLIFGANNHQMVTLNLVLWHLAISEKHWDVIAGAYQQLLSHTHEPELADTDTSFLSPSSPPLLALLVPARLRPSRDTYSILIRSTAYQGDLAASLEVMRHMFGDGFAPHVPEYMALFEGFARYGVIYDGPRGKLSAMFPKFEHIAPAGLGGSGARGKRADAGGMGGRIGSIWTKGLYGSGDQIPRFSPDSDDDGYPGDGESLWTSEALYHLFETFLTLSPRAQHKAAPSAKNMWNIVLAFARVQGSDVDVIEEVWRSLEGKFGPLKVVVGDKGGYGVGDEEGEGEDVVDAVVAELAGGLEGEEVLNREGWTGWRTDRRLRRLEAALERG